MNLDLARQILALWITVAALMILFGSWLFYWSIKYSGMFWGVTGINLALGGVFAIAIAHEKFKKARMDYFHQEQIRDYKNWVEQGRPDDYESIADYRDL